VANESVSICVNLWLKWRLSSVIIAARGVTLSNFLSGLLETDAIVLHCDERYQPTPATVLPKSFLGFRLGKCAVR
jgi:hypothetical protein